MSQSGTSSTPQTFLGRLFSSVSATVKSDASAALSGISSLLSSAETVVTHEVWPFVQNLFHTIELDVVAQIKPLAEEALAELGADLPVLFSQGWEGFLKIFSPVLTATVQKAEAAGINAAEHDVLIAVQSVIANAKAGAAQPGN